MPRHFAQLTFTDHVKAAQADHAARAHNERHQAGAFDDTRLGARERAFIAARDSFYLATVSETGWPYVQHRGGAPGFLRVLDAVTLACADFAGNLQYLSVGNLRGNDRVSLILLDYPRRRRLKLLGRARMLDRAEADRRAPGLFGQAAPDGARVERVLLIELAAFDWNCSRHITPRYDEQALQDALAPLRARVAVLEARLRQLGCAPP